MTTEPCCGEAGCKDRSKPWFFERTCTPEDTCTQRASVASEPVPRASLTRVHTAHAALAHVHPAEHRKLKWWDHGLWQPPRLMVEEDGAHKQLLCSALLPPTVDSLTHCYALPLLFLLLAGCYVSSSVSGLLLGAGSSEEEREMTWSELFFDLVRSHSPAECAHNRLLIALMGEPWPCRSS